MLAVSRFKEMASPKSAVVPIQSNALVLNSLFVALSVYEPYKVYCAGNKKTLYYHQEQTHKFLDRGERIFIDKRQLIVEQYLYTGHLLSETVVDANLGVLIEIIAAIWRAITFDFTLMNLNTEYTGLEFGLLMLLL
jgi:hypothetical protein